MSAAAPPPALSAAAIAGGDTEQLSLLLRHTLAAPEPAATGLVDRFWEEWQRGCGLHETALAALAPLRGELSAAAASLPCWLNTPAHPVWAALSTLHQVALGYQPELGRAAARLLAELEQWPAAVAGGGWAAAAADGAARWQQEQTRVQRLEQRLIDVERGQLRARRAQQQAAQFLNRQLSGKQLPRSLNEFFSDTWCQELQWCVLQFGPDSAQWHQRAALTARLVASLQPDGDDPAQRQRLYALIPDLGPELRDILGARAADQHLLERQLAAVEAQHLAVLRGQPLDYAPFALSSDADPWLAPGTSISSELLARVEALAPGQWFLSADSEPASRIKLVLKLDDSGQLLFANRLGVKAGQKSFEEFAFLLAVGDVVPLPAADCAAQALLRVLERLVEDYNAQQQLRSQARERTETDARRRVEARTKAIAEAKALAEAGVQATARQAREQEIARRRDAQEQQGADAAQRQKTARQQALLPVGSWVELHDELGASQRLKLAVKLPSSGKMIFVDREGVRRAEFAPDAFSARLLDGSLRILDQGPQFEDTLARVVGSLRRDRSGRE